MTPEREKYLAKCSKREKFLRREIDNCKRSLKFTKRCWNDKPDVLFKFSTTEECEAPLRNRVRDLKWQLSALQHELAHLKGMDRVVVPIPIKAGRETFPDQSYICKCLKYLGWVKDINYCPKCGKRVLWGEVNGI